MINDYTDYYYYNVFESFFFTPGSTENNFSKFYSALNKPERFFDYASNKEIYDTLLDPLMWRWNNPHCVLVVSDHELSVSERDTKSLRTDRILSLLVKLGNVMRVKVQEYNKYITMINQNTFSDVQETSTNGTSRSNDTPNAIGNYDADKYASSVSSTSGSSTSKASSNEYQTYDIIANRVRDWQDEIIREMEKFEIWI